MNRFNKSLLVTGLAFTSTFGIVGCSKTEEVKQEEKTTETKQETKEEVLKSIGTKSDTTTEIKLTNKTGKEITAMAIIKADGSESENILEEAFANEEARNFYYEVEQGQTYDVKVNTADAEYVLHGFPMDAKEASIVVADDMAYVEYKDANGQSQSTKERETALIEEAQAAQQMAQQQEVVQQPVEQTPVQQAPVQQTPVQEAPVVQTPVQEVPATQTAPSTGDTCVTGAFD